MSNFSVYLLILLYAELIMIGMILTMPKTADKMCHNIDLGVKIIFTFLLWGMNCGSKTYIITSTYNGKTKTITFGGE